MFEKIMSSTVHNQNTLYYDINDVSDIKSHCCRMAIAYKGIQVDFKSMSRDNPEAIFEVNPYGGLPSWIDRDVALYDWRTIFEYMEERYPAPSLLPQVPGSRATIRSLCYRIDRDWLARIAHLELRDEVERLAVAKSLSDGLVSLIPHIQKQGFMASETLTYADCMLAAILWRLPLLGISLPSTALPLVEYAKRLFAMSFFKQSLTPQERSIYLTGKVPA
jgi:RNA polymerase-associated protein